MNRYLYRWVIPLCVVGTFLASVALVKRTDVFWADYETAGLKTIAYCLGRSAVAFFVFVSALTLGSVLLRVAARQDPLEQSSGLGYLIACFYLGASCLGFMVTIAGVAGLLNLHLGLAVVIPLLLMAPSQLGELAARGCRKTWEALRATDRFTQMMHWVLVCLVFVAGGALFMTKVIYPASVEEDVWGGYLPYYRSVLETGNAGPHEVWYHYWSLRGAGLTFVLGTLTDAFSAPLASWCFIVVTGLIVTDLLIWALDETKWGLLGLVIFLASMLADPSRGAFFRVTAPITGYAAFAMWVTIRLLQGDSFHRKGVLLAGLVAGVYAGFFLNLGVCILVAFFGFITISTVSIRGLRSSAKYSAALLGATAAGIGADFLVNQAATGLGGMFPLSVLWKIANHKKFLDQVGPSGMLYFLSINNGLGSSAWLNTRDWFLTVYRWDFFKAFILGVLVLVGLRAAFPRAGAVEDGRLWRRWLLVAFVAGALLVPAFLVALSVRPPNLASTSVMRMCHFVDPPLTLLLVLSAGGLAAVVSKRAPISRTPALLMTVLAGLSVGILIYRSRSELRLAMSFARGNVSTANLFQMRAPGDPDETERLEFVTAVRRRIGPKAKIFSLSSGAGPSFSFPGVGLSSEPSCTLGPQGLEMIFGTPDQAALLLRSRGWNFFHVSLGSPLFSGLPYSRLFQVAHLERYFTLGLRQGKHYLLTWRESGDVTPLPGPLLQRLELEQLDERSPFVKIIGEKFYIEVREALVAATLKQHDPHALTSADLCAALSEVVEREVLMELSCRDNLLFFRSSIASATREADEKFADILVKSRRIAHDPSASEETVARRFADELTQVSVSIIVARVRDRCPEEFGADLIDLLPRKEPWNPFRTIYRSRKTASTILGTVMPD